MLYWRNLNYCDLRTSHSDRNTASTTSKPRIDHSAEDGTKSVAYSYRKTVIESGFQFFLFQKDFIQGCSAPRKGELVVDDGITPIDVEIEPFNNPERKIRIKP